MRAAVVIGLGMWAVALSARAQDAGVPTGMAEVAVLVGRGEDSAALARLEALGAGGRTTAGRYLRARLLERLDRPGEAADALAAGLGGLPAPVVRDAARRRALDLVAAARCPEARPLLDALHETRPDVLGAVATCAAQAGDVPAALTAQRAAVRLSQFDFELRFALAELLARSGDTDGARRELRALLVARPDHPKESAARTRIEALDPAGPVAFTLDERLARAERFTHVRMPARAVAELAGVAPPADAAERTRLLHVRGMALFSTRHDYAEAAHVLAEAAARGGDTALADAFHAARALARADRDAEAITAYRRIVRAHPDTDEAAQAEYLGAMLELRLARREGRAHLRAFVDGPRAARAPNDAKEARFQLAFADLDGRRYAAARAGFDAYGDAGTGGMQRGRGRYWSGRAAELARRRDAAVASYRAAISAEPLHWYALLAHLRLRALGVSDDLPMAPAPPEETPAPLPPPALPELARFYGALGLFDDALRDLGAHEDAVRAAAPHGRETESLAAAYLALGDAGHASRLGDPPRQRLDHAPGPADAWAWAASYPRPYATDVDAATRARHLPDGILWAIMRQESSYDPTVVSGADAIGLLQLLPGVAQGLAREIGDPVPAREDLMHPEVNVRLAAAYVAALLDAFGGQAPFAIGGFNAGGGRVRHWLTTALPGEELDHFVERIPIDQTRNYVRRVTTHLVRYRWLRDPSRGWPDLPEVSLTIDRSRVRTTEHVPPPAPPADDDDEESAPP